jgi:hypothetical protein
MNRSQLKEFASKLKESRGDELEVFVEVDVVKAKYPNKTEAERAGISKRIASAIGENNLIIEIDMVAEIDSEYVDNSFDWEAGDQHGTHNPGSGFELGGIKLEVTDSVHAYDDATGQPTKVVIFKSGTIIPESALTKIGQRQLERAVDSYLQKKTSDDASSRDERDDDEDRYNENNITMKQSNINELKSIIKKLVLQEITVNTNTLGTTDSSSDDTAVKALDKAVKEGNASKPAGSSKVVAKNDTQQAELSKQSPDCYDVISVTNGSDRKIAKNLKLDDAIEFIKKHAKDSEKTYMQKAYDKSEKGFGKKVDEKTAKAIGNTEADTDKMEDTKEDSQVEIAGKEDKKADEKGEKSLKPIDKDNSPQMGGALVDKIEKIIDMALKGKADSKTAYLKADKDMESPDKLAVKLDGTNAIKGAKSKEKITPKVKAVDSKK